jgi:hypothetical protein
MFKKVATFIVLLSATSLTLIQTQQPAQASFLGDLGKLLGVVGTAVDGVNRATQPDGSVDAGALIRVGGKYVTGIDQIINSPEPEYQSDTESRSSQTEQADESAAPSEVQQSEDEPEQAVSADSDDSEPAGQYEDASE